MSGAGSPPDRRDELAVAAAFDRTAEPPSQLALQRMAARAAEIPVANRPWWSLGFPLWARVATALVGVGGVSAALLLSTARPDERSAPVPPIAVTSAPESTDQLSPPALATDDGDDLDEPSDGDELPEPYEDVADLDVAFGGDELGLDVMGSPSDADAEVWLYVYEQMLRKGG